MAETGSGDTSGLRILEIGCAFYFKAEYPDRTTLLWTGGRLLPGPELIDGLATPGRVRAELAAATRGRYDVVIAYPMRHGGANPRNWLANLARQPLAPWAALTRAFATSLIRFAPRPVPVIAIDMDDAFNLSGPGLFLIDHADAFLKRELPVDRWLVLSGHVHRDIATSRFRKSPRWKARIDKLQPISLPQWAIAPALTDGPFPEKTADLFFSGDARHNSSVRSDGLAALRRLSAAGVRVDLVAGGLAHADYLKRMAAAWLAWSPAGRGWDCNRHYEAALVQTVPVMNLPTILRHRPLEDGVHAIYYPPEGDGLERAVLAALADTPRLRRMALAARDHARAHHTRKATCDHILELALALRRKNR